MKYEEILKILPLKINEEVSKHLKEDSVQEIRIKVSKPIIINSYNNEVILDYVTSEGDMKEILMKISNYSLYAYEEEIKQGYITLKGGHRVGLAGECVLSGKDIKTMKNISSINIRISREVIGSSNKIMPYIIEEGKVLNTLIVSPPKCGKTTILRDIAKNISNGMYTNELKGKKVAIVDERSEIAASFNGVPQMNVGIRTDVLDNCLKSLGMIMAIRSLSPEVIVCDEIGSRDDLEALNMAYNSGVNIVITVHGNDLEDVCTRKVLKELIDSAIVERVIVLSNRNKVGNIEKIYRIKSGGNLQCIKL